MFQKLFIACVFILAFTSCGPVNVSEKVDTSGKKNDPQDKAVDFRFNLNDIRYGALQAKDGDSNCLQAVSDFVTELQKTQPWQIKSLVVKSESITFDGNTVGEFTKSGEIFSVTKNDYPKVQGFRLSATWNGKLANSFGTFEVEGRLGSMVRPLCSTVYALSYSAQKL